MAETFMSVTGLTELRDRLKELGPKGRRSIAKTMYQMAEQIMLNAKKLYVPVEENILRSSGEVGKPIETAGEISVSMGFGGNASDYALAIHEHFSAHSPPTWKSAETKGEGVHFRVGGPKYLEKPFFEMVDGGKLEGALARGLEGDWQVGGFGGGATGGGLL